MIYRIVRCVRERMLQKVYYLSLVLIFLGITLVSKVTAGAIMAFQSVTNPSDTYLKPAIYEC